jgi:hypothetical protein
MFPSFFNFAPSRLTRQKEEKKAKSAERDVKSFLKMLSSEKSSLFVHTHPRKHLQNKLPKDSRTEKGEQMRGEVGSERGENLLTVTLN